MKKIDEIVDGVDVTLRLHMSKASARLMLKDVGRDNEVAFSAYEPGDMVLLEVEFINGRLS